MVGERRLELPASWSRTKRATDCATPRQPYYYMKFPGCCQVENRQSLMSNCRRTDIEWWREEGGSMTAKHSPRHLQDHTPLRDQYRPRQPMHGKREEEEPRSGKRMVRLVICAMLLAVVVGVKLTAPDVTEKYGGKLLDLMGKPTDFSEVFSAVGKAVGRENILEVFSDAYIAVFGGEEIEEIQETVAVGRNEVVYDEANTPPQATMLQQVLGFDYGNPVCGTVTSVFGYRNHPIETGEKFHYGLDIAAEEGEIIRAFADGKVTVIGESSELGKYVELCHENGYTTLYAHCSKVTASSGQRVKRGDPIAEVGKTGEATGSHLHFALYQDTLYLNPIYYVQM